MQFPCSPMLYFYYSQAYHPEFAVFGPSFAFPSQKTSNQIHAESNQMAVSHQNQNSQPQAPKTNVPKRTIIAKEQRLKDRKNSPQNFRRKNSDEDFAHRRQTPNRNLGSNTFKIYLQQVRKIQSETYRNLTKIIKTNSKRINIEEYLEILEREFSLKATYYSYDKIWRTCEEGVDESRKEFATIFRISLRHFFLYQIYFVGVRSIRTTRKIRNMQINHGKMLVKNIRPSKS